MKAKIEVDGTLHITPETELEIYALKKWSEDNLSPGKAKTCNRNGKLLISFVIQRGDE